MLKLHLLMFPTMGFFCSGTWGMIHAQAASAGGPLDGSLLGDEGLGLAVRFIQWIGTNMKTYNYKGKAKELVMHSASGDLIQLLSASIWTDTGFFMQTISILEAVHSALQNRYSDQQMMKEGRSRNDVSLQSWQNFQKFVVLML